MIKVKASLIFKGEERMPTDIVLDIPKEDCNRDNWNDYIKEALFSILNDRVKIDYDLIEETK